MLFILYRESVQNQLPAVLRTQPRVLEIVSPPAGKKVSKEPENSVYGPLAGTARYEKMIANRNSELVFKLETAEKPDTADPPWDNQSAGNLSAPTLTW